MKKAVYMSAAVRTGARDPATGMPIGCVLDHVALTEAPLLKRKRAQINRRRRWQQILVAGKYGDIMINTEQLRDIVRNWKHHVPIFDTHESGYARCVNAIVGVVRDIRISDSDSELLGRVEWAKT